MKTKKTSLSFSSINHLISIGSKEIAIEDECIKLSEGYFLSMEE